MNQERLHAAAGERWERVASSFLRPAPAPRFLVGVSGADDEQRVQRIAREVREGLGDLLDPSGAGGARVEVKDLGAVNEKRLVGLAGEGLKAPDLLVWSMSPRTASSSRSFYLLGTFVWTLSPRSVGCVLEAGILPAARFEAGQKAIRAASGVQCPLALYLLQGAAETGRSCTLGGIVQAALARADARARQGADKRELFWA